MKDFGWDEKKYRALKLSVQREIDLNKKSPYDFMQEYKRAVVDDEFEYCKAITEVLRPLNYHTADTHPHIQQLTD